MNKIIFLGEAWGKDEDALRRPFVGAAGQELYRMLVAAGFPGENLPYNFVSPFSMTKRWDRFPYPLLNVFNRRPPDPDNKNRAEYFYGHPTDETAVLDKSLPARKIGQSKYYVQKKYSPDVQALHDTLNRMRPNLIVALGNTPLWSLGLPQGIGKIRGSIIDSNFGKVLPIYHPAAVLRNWKFRTISIIDFMKAKREMEYPEIRTTERFIWTEPTIPDLYSWWNKHGKNTKLLAVDIETLRKTQISEIGFAASPTQALHIPFLLEHRKGNKVTGFSRYYSREDEILAWQFVKMVLESSVPKIGQNVIQYDAYWLIKEMGFTLHNFVDDVMVKAHCWQPELEKNLGFLGSIFLDEKSWKHIRRDVGKLEG